MVSATDDYTPGEFEKIFLDIKAGGASLHTLLITHGPKLVKELERMRQDYAVEPDGVNYATIRRALAEISGIPAMSVVTMAHIEAIKAENEALHALLARFRYAAAFAGADAWDGGEDSVARLKHAKAQADCALGNLSNDQLAALGRQFLDESGY